MRHESVCRNTRRLAYAALAVLLCCVFVAPARARNVIRWYDDQGNLHTIELSDLGPYEQRVQEEKVERDRGMDAPRMGDQKVSQEAPPQSEQLEQDYEKIKARRELREKRDSIQQQIRATDNQIDSVDQELQEIQQEIIYKKNRRARLRDRKGSRIRLYNEIEALESQLQLLVQKKQSLQSKKEALRQQMPPAQPNPGSSILP